MIRSDYVPRKKGRHRRRVLLRGRVYDKDVSRYGRNRDALDYFSRCLVGQRYDDELVRSSSVHDPHNRCYELEIMVDRLVRTGRVYRSYP